MGAAGADPGGLGEPRGKPRGRGLGSVGKICQAGAAGEAGGDAGELLQVNRLPLGTLGRDPGLETARTRVHLGSCSSGQAPTLLIFKETIGIGVSMISAG